MSYSQILAIVGLLFEALSVAYTAKGVYLFSFTDKARYERFKEDLAKGKGSTVTRALRIRQREMYVVLLLLSIGMILQGIALFV